MAKTDDIQQQLTDENQRLKRAIEELTILNDLARAISSSLDSEEIMRKVIHRSLKAMHCEQGVITLVQDKQNQSTKTLLRTMVSSNAHEQFHAHQALLGWMQLNKKPLLMNNPHNDDRFKGVVWDEHIHSLLGVPLIVKSELKGILTVYNKKEANGFTNDDQRLLAIIAAQSGQVIETARLYEEEKLLLQMKHELDLASKIQIDLLPKDIPNLQGYEIAGKTIPANSVGGDYFDFIQIDEDRMAFCLGDVSGKGLPASLLMANLQATIRGQTIINTSPRECITRANKLLYHSTSPEKFATLFYALLDLRKHCIYTCNAGHEFPFLLTERDESRQIESDGLMLGAFENVNFKEQCIELHHGDIFVVTSDGISEAMNPEREQFGNERLEQLLRDRRSDSPSELIQSIVGAVQTHAQGCPQSDDMTIVVLKRM